jgi:hypothetical protein
MAPKQATSPTPRLISAKSAAREIGVPYGTLRDAHFRGELAVVRIGKEERHSAWYVDRADLNAWIEARKVRG